MTSRTYRDPVEGRSPVDPHPRRRCVRCGTEAPLPELFIGPACHADPDTAREVRNIEEGFTDYRQQRKALRLFGWYGGWWR